MAARPQHSGIAQTPRGHASAEAALRLRMQPTGTPIRMKHGHFAGKTIRAQITEVQKADVGRKFGHADPRPLDPPPVVHFQLFEVMNPGTPHQNEREMSADEINGAQLVCIAELYPWNPEYESDPAAFPAARAVLPYPIQRGTGRPPPIPLAREHAYPTALLLQPLVAPPEHSLLRLLHGRTTVAPHVVPDVLGGRGMVVYFVFSELLVSAVGHFLLKFRATEILTGDRTAVRTMPVLAECFGGVFAIYQSKAHPPLRPSTDITNHLSKHGVKLHNRATTRSAPSRKHAVAQPEQDDGDSQESESEPDSPPSPARPTAAPGRSRRPYSPLRASLALAHAHRSPC